MGSHTSYEVMLIMGSHTSYEVHIDLFPKQHMT